MVYVFDTSSFRVLENYFPQTFKKFWQCFDASVLNGEIISPREVYNELKSQVNKPHLVAWIDTNKRIFEIPSAKETEFVGQIFGIPHFQQLVSERHRLRGTPVADPFVIAMAKVRGGCVVTEEAKKENAARIPNVCEYFGISCRNVEGFMEAKGWEF